MHLSDLISGTDVRPAGDAGEAAARLRICDITEDSRTVMPGSLFVARRGGSFDGREFVGQAVEAGAAAVLTDDASLRLPERSRRGRPVALLVTGDVSLATARLAERFYGGPSSRLSLIGVTGTNGKTTTTYLIHQMLNAASVRCGMIGTVCVDDGCEIAPAQLTTPQAIELSRTLGVMVEAGCRAAALEVSSHALAQKRTAGLTFAAAVFTNLTGDHMDYHGSPESYADAKALLFESLGESAVAVVNADDPASQRMVRDSRARIVRCSGANGDGGGSADCAVRVEESSASGMMLALDGPWGRVRAHVSLVGAYNAMNALEAAAVCHAAAGLDAGAIVYALERVGPPPGRLESVTPAHAPFQVLIDYAHTDDALRNVLSALRSTRAGHAAGRVWIVFGCGGDRDAAKRPRMGAAAAELADRLVLTSDNPRTEDPLRIIDDVLEGLHGVEPERLHVEPDRALAIEHAVAHAEPGDVVLIAGKGHEDYQILPDGRGGTYRRHFDDREQARAALSARGLPVRSPSLLLGCRADEPERQHQDRSTTGTGSR